MSRNALATWGKRKKKKEKGKSVTVVRDLAKWCWRCCYRDDTVKGLCMQNFSCDCDMTGEVFRQFGVAPKTFWGEQDRYRVWCNECSFLIFLLFV